MTHDITKECGELEFVRLRDTLSRKLKKMATAPDHCSNTFRHTNAQTRSAAPDMREPR